MTRGSRNDYAGKRFGNLVADKFVGVDAANNALWSCVCDCGKVVTVRAHLLKKAQYCSRNCGKNVQVKDISGQRFGRLTPMVQRGIDACGKALWLCQCDCGKESITTGERLRNGTTRSCGCLEIESRIKHGRSKTREYKSERYMAYVAARRRSTPIAGVDSSVLALYKHARNLTALTGIPHEVDHVIPLQGKTVSGLHVYANLKVVTRSENRRKSRKFSPMRYAELTRTVRC